MNLNRRRGTIAFFIALGVVLSGVAITLNIGWIMLHPGQLAVDILGVILFSALIAGVVLNTVFIVREIRRNERQDSFLNAVTHELKTPIASIRLYLETLQRRPVPEEQRQEFYGIMLADSERLLATVEQVLKAGQLGSKHRAQNRTSVDLQSLVEECVSITLQRHHLPPEAILLAPSSPDFRPRVLGLAEDLRTAVLNVLDNAVKYSPEGVHVRCSLILEPPETIAFRVTDSGVGIPPDHLKRVFNRFYRVPGRTMVRVKGTGLGLFLVRAIARQHGGNASAQSLGPGKGATITLTLPLANTSDPLH